MKMKAATLVAQGAIEFGQAPLPEIKTDDEVLIRTVVTAICGSDLHTIFSGTGPEPYPCRHGYPGHESIGEVVESRLPGIPRGTVVLPVPDMSYAAAFAEYQV